MNKLKRLAAIAVCAFTAFGFAACANSAGNTGGNTDDEGNGGNENVGGGEIIQGPVEKTEYEKFCASYPDYNGSEEQYELDKASGKLDLTHSYSIIKDGVLNADAEVLEGTVSPDGDLLSLKSAKIALAEPVILPLSRSAESSENAVKWEIDFEGTVFPNGVGGGQLLCNEPDSSKNGRIYLGVNISQKAMYFGVYYDGTFVNYYWDLSDGQMLTDNSYKIQYKGGEYILSVGGEEKKISAVNIGNDTATRTAVTDSKAASAELTEKICAVSGQEYLTFTHMGASGGISFTCTNKLSDFSVTTSYPIYNYTELSAHPLSGKTVYFLGSSITHGVGSTEGISFANLAADLTGYHAEKQTVSGTTLAVQSNRTDSYCERLLNFNLSEKPDAFVVQLSTNDFNGTSILKGQVSDKTSSADFDRTTLTGALEYIISVVHELSPDTKIIIYTCALVNWSYESSYKTYVNGTLQDLLTKYSDYVSVLDLYHADWTDIGGKFMQDAMHPTRVGYGQLYVPAFVNLLTDLLK